MKFQPRQSGNPTGRPKGARHKTTLAIESLLDGEAEALTRKVIEKAKEGDIAALKLCLDRLVPMRKGRPIEIDLPDVNCASDLAKAGAVVTQQLGEGFISPEEAAAVIVYWLKDHMALIVAVRSLKGPLYAEPQVGSLHH